MFWMFVTVGPKEINVKFFRRLAFTRALVA